MDDKLLIIVESPNKIKTLKKYIPHALFDASVGHVCDLPSSSMGLTEDLKPIYEITKPDVIAKIKSKMPGRKVVLMTDSDREGEAISYHLHRILNLGDNYIRVCTQSLTKKEIEKAFAKARKIDMEMVAAQECRRVADRLIGYRVSNYTRKLLKANSAGRVQTVALKLLVDRSKLIAAFNKTPYLQLECTHLDDLTNQFWTSNLDIETIINSEKFDDFLTPIASDMKRSDRRITSIPFMQAIQKKVFEIGELKVCKHNSTSYKTKAPAPFTSSKLIQAASSRLGFATETTMSIAQKLFEKGVITYHRSDSTCIEPESINAIRNYINDWQEKNNLNGYLPLSINVHSESEHVQAGHEAIRPNDLYRTTDDLNEQEKILYQLIHSQTIASQMSEAVFQKNEYLLDTGISTRDCPIRFIASGKSRTFDGWQAFSRDDIAIDKLLPTLVENDLVKINNLQLKRKFTKAPSRYTEAKLIDEIDKRGIGRPSTYSSIIKTLIHRLYAKRFNEFIEATQLGIKLVDSLDGHFSFMDYTYTANNEAQFDNVAHGKLQYSDVVNKINNDLSNEIDEYLSSLSEKINFQTCPSCEKRTLVKRTLDKVTFNCISESCNKTFDYFDGKLIVKDSPKSSELSCPKCNKNKLKYVIKNNITFCFCEKKCGFFCEAELRDGSLVLPDINQCPICKNGILGRKTNKKTNSFYWSCHSCNNSFGDNNGTVELKDVFKCPNCTSGRLILSSKKEWFFCNNNKNNTCKTFLKNNNGQPDMLSNPEKPSQPAKHKCPNCNHSLIYRLVSDTFICEDYNNCRTSFNSKDGKPNIDELKLKQKKPFI